ncbi:MAG TPA: family 43 glycosylhydrolase [Polyangiaceae bacterium]|nr:family 43 glycosylhydrolase [Polyangiaceae bacterium]
MRTSNYGSLIGALLFGAVLAAPSTSWADNPIVQTNYTADPAPMVVGDTVYLCTSHDEDVTVDNFFTMNDWRVYSSKDMVNWTDHGSPLSYQSFSWADGKAWAPHCVERDGKFYFYVPVSDSIGVAVADSPIGPFEDAIGEPLVSNYQYIDPTVFVDDDGQAYLYFGNPRLWYVELNDDMTSFTGQVTQIENTTQSFGERSGDADRPTLYEEGPWFYKRNDQYYMIFAMGPLPERIGYATSSAPLGPWTYRGVIMESQSGHAFTNHAGVVDFKGKSYFFYHTQELPGGGGYKRSVAVEEFSYGADGSIPIINKTSEGVTESAEPLNPFVQVEAETIAWEEGIETEPCSEGGMNVTEISDGDYIKVEQVEFGAGADTFNYRVAAGSGGGAIELRLDGEDGDLAGTCMVESSGGADTWATQECSVNITGAHDLFLRFTGGGFKFNWWQFAGPGEPTTDGAGGATATGSVSTTATVTDGGGGSTTTATSTGNAQTTGTNTQTASTTTGTSATVGGTTAATTTTGAAASTTGTSGAVNTTATSGGLGGATATGGGPSSSGTSGSSDEGGCSCGVAGANSTPGALGLFGALGLVLLASTRRREGRAG